MELFISLAILVAVVELKEWRQSKRVDLIISRLDLISKNLNIMHSEIQIQKEILEALESDFEIVQSKLPEYFEKLDEIKNISEKAEANSATILREYELNGIPLGYQRKQPEFIETL